MEPPKPLAWINVFPTQFEVPIAVAFLKFADAFSGIDKQHLAYLLDHDCTGMVSASSFHEMMKRFGPHPNLAGHIASIFNTPGFLGYVSQTTSQQMLSKLAFVPGTFIIRFSNNPTEDFVVDFVALSPNDEVYLESAVIKCLGGLQDAYGLRFSTTTRIVGASISEILSKFKLTTTPFNHSFPKQRYFHGFEVAYKHELLRYPSGSYLSRVTSANPNTVVIIRVDQATQVLNSFPLRMHEGRFYLGPKAFDTVEAFLAAHSSLFTHPIPIKSRAIIHFDTDRDIAVQLAARREFCLGAEYFNLTSWYRHDSLTQSFTSFDENTPRTLDAPAQSGISLLNIPIDVQKLILQYVIEPHDIASAVSVCTSWHTIMSDAAAWKTRFLSLWRFAILGESVTNIDWKSLYVDFRRLNLRRRFCTAWASNSTRLRTFKIVPNVAFTSGSWYFRINLKSIELTAEFEISWNVATLDQISSCGPLEVLSKRVQFTTVLEGETTEKEIKDGDVIWCGIKCNPGDKMYTIWYYLNGEEIVAQENKISFSGKFWIYPIITSRCGPQDIVDLNFSDATTGCPFENEFRPLGGSSVVPFFGDSVVSIGALRSRGGGGEGEEEDDY